MYILKMRHGNDLKDLLIFDTEAQGQDFINSFPYLRQNHYRIEEVVFSDYYFKPHHLPDYFTWEHEGIKIPMTRFTFVEEDENAYFELHSLDHFKQVEKTYIDGATRVDAWVVDNQEVKKYIEDRERIAEALQEALRKEGYEEIDRCYFGSEDGEAILARKGEMTFFTHLDAGLIHDYENTTGSFDDFINKLINEN
ncbi:MAG TPA: hypothetical protein VIG45_07180 [Erysipelothrix sp.]